MGERTRAVWLLLGSSIGIVALAVLPALQGCASEDPSSSSRAETEPSTETAPLDGTEASSSPEAPVLAPTGEGPLPGAGAGEAAGLASDAERPGTELTPESSCAALAVEAETIERVVEVPIEEQVVVPSVFYLMLDSSGSMVSDSFSLADFFDSILDVFGLGSDPEPTKWDYTLDGLESFLEDPASAGLELGLGYFPGAGQCNGVGYDVPSVALGPLPDNTPALQASLRARQPAGGTPLEGALRGVTNFCLAYNAEHPEASCVSVLITDGAAEQCDARSAAELAAIAQRAREGGVLTFAAGMEGADFGVLNAIGQAGGGDCDPDSPGFACDLTADRDAFVRALNGIRDRTRTQVRVERRTEEQIQTLPCEWEIPPAPAGRVFDATRVNVQLSAPGQTPEPLASVALAAECGTSGGWYYDDARAPARIHACPATCSSLQAQPETRVELLFGCRTVLR